MKKNLKEVSVLTVCPICGHANEVEVNEEDYLDWGDGVMVQTAFPYLSPSEREMLISGICPTCWAKTFEGKEEDDEVFSDFYEGRFDEVGFDPYCGCYTDDC